ncbi:MAG TPA: allantoate amidohydrolase [Streptosporangiaceae bacterium]
MGFAELWEALLPAGRQPGGGYRRYSWTEADQECRAWFLAAAGERGLRAETDRNGNLWAWWEPPGSEGQPAVVTGSHLDSVPDGGAFDGPLGVVSGFAALDELRERGVTPARPVAVAAFTEEEGARFGIACLGSRLLTGTVTAEKAAALTDGQGVTLAQAMTESGLDPARLGPDDERLSRIGSYVELHVEQGSALAGLGAAIGVGEAIWAHGRWRLEFTGQPDHAGTTRLGDRHDPMLPFAATVLAARRAAASTGGLATVGKVIAEPGAVNAISARVTGWLDARAADEPTMDAIVAEVTTAAQAEAARQHVTVTITRESLSPRTDFDAALRGRVTAALARAGITAPVLPTGAGHDAGFLAARLPTAMLFVRNPTGVSHSPAEYAGPDDCAAGVRALAAVLADLAGP